MDAALVIDKPEGMTSHDVVARVRRAASTRRVGHAGTLDPFATGVLVVCIGRATRLVQFLVGLDKEYIARVKLGYSTDTQDLTGKPVTPLISSYGLSVEDVQDALKEFIGPQLQVPPMYSAKKVGGERLYRAARAGREVSRPAVPVAIHSLRLAGSASPVFELAEDGTLEFDIEVGCSSGTYIRTLAHDLGERLGKGGHLVALRRTRVGHFDISQSHTLEEISYMAGRGRLESLLVTSSEVVGHLPEVMLDSRAVEMVANGRSLSIDLGGSEGTKGGQYPVRLLDQDGALVAVGEYDILERSIRPKVVFCENRKDEMSDDHESE